MTYQFKIYRKLPDDSWELVEELVSTIVDLAIRLNTLTEDGREYRAERLGNDGNYQIINFN